jgi:hypothetical protein
VFPWNRRRRIRSQGTWRCRIGRRVTNWVRSVWKNVPAQSSADRIGDIPEIWVLTKIHADSGADALVRAGRPRPAIGATRGSRAGQGGLPHKGIGFVPSGRMFQPKAQRLHREYPRKFGFVSSNAEWRCPAARAWGAPIGLTCDPVSAYIVSRQAPVLTIRAELETGHAGRSFPLAGCAQRRRKLERCKQIAWRRSGRSGFPALAASPPKMEGA